MMLAQSKFYTISEQQTVDSKLIVQLQINSDHEIFEGHFPGLPIVPGVCMLQMVRELCEDHLELKLAIAEVNNMKFIAAYNPLEHSTSQMEIAIVSQEDAFKITAMLKSDAVIFFKLNAVFK